MIKRGIKDKVNDVLAYNIWKLKNTNKKTKIIYRDKNNIQKTKKHK